MASLKLTPKTEKQSPSLQQYSSQSRSHLKQPPPQCLSCQQTGNIICYACCYSLACEKCFSHEHFINCGRHFNKHTLNISGGVLQEQNKSKKNGKNKFQGKCKRCETSSQLLQWCKQCRISYCRSCSNLVHSKGKFLNHHRTVSHSPQKAKRFQTVKTENVEEDSFKWTKENTENLEYGFKAREKNVRNTPSYPMKKGRSMAKNSFDNQENTPVHHKRKNSIAMSDVDSKSRKPNEVSALSCQENPWLVCQRHPKLRTILTQSFDLVCSDCYEDFKQLTTKIKTIDIQSCLNSEAESSKIASCVQGVLDFAKIKASELGNEFQRYRKELESEYTIKKDILEERYKSNLLNVDKWFSVYQEGLNNLNQKCQQFRRVQTNIRKEDDLQCFVAKNMDKVSKLQAFILYEEIVRMKRQFTALQEQYHFKVSEINPELFEDLLKNFSFTRRRSQQPPNAGKNINKMSQSTQMRQSRISNSSLTSDRKYLRREESMIKSSYYELSHSSNLMKRSVSKDIKQDITKDISQRILFPTNSDKKEMYKPKDIKNSNTKQKNSYFFENPPQENKLSLKLKECEHPDIGFKDVKYINLETIITEKLDKGTEKGEKKEHLELSTPALIDDTKTTYTVEANEDLPEPKPEKSHINIPEARMIQSITLGQAQETRGTVPSGSNIQAVKSKRKSDYMEMRDRLRKPSMMGKIPK